MPHQQRRPSLFEAILPIAFLILLLSFNVILFDDPLEGSNQVALKLAAALAGMIGLRLGNSWKKIRGQIVKSISTAMPVILILLLIGALSGTRLILSAMFFGGVMEATGMLRKITVSVLSLVKSDGSLISSTALSCIFFNVTASDQYISIVVPGEMYKEAFHDRGLKPEVLSRSLEDAGTVTSVLVPWNTVGATQARVLGVSTLSYLPYAFFNLISPVMTILFAYFNIRIRRLRMQKRKGKKVLFRFSFGLLPPPNQKPCPVYVLKVYIPGQ